MGNEGDRIDKYLLLWVMVCNVYDFLDLNCALTLALFVQNFLNVYQVHIPEQIESPGFVFAQFLHGFCSYSQVWSNIFFLILCNNNLKLR